MTQENFNEEIKEQFIQWSIEHKKIAASTASNYASVLDNYNPNKYRLSNNQKTLDSNNLFKTSLFKINNKDIINSMYNKLLEFGYESKNNSNSDWKDDHKNLSSALLAYNEFLSDVQQNIYSQVKSNNIPISHNLIYFGAPGTGKSYQLNELVKNYFTNRYERITFYADYLHSQFVGSYKPITVTNRSGKDISTIEYQFRPGPFTRVLIRALNDPNQPYALVIEELNRAEAASVFGDAFQLLDRNDEGQSEYAITVSEDLREYLSHKEAASEPTSLTTEGRDNLQRLTGQDDCSQIAIPSNMYILATMNSADQGVFPLDTAFKRRWNFKYVSIDEGKDIIKDQDWVTKYRIAINENLLNADIPEDKQMGPFFLGNINLEFGTPEFDEAMKNKVIMYLFEDAAKYHPTKIFNTEVINGTLSETGKKLSLQKLFDAWDKINYGIFQGLTTVDKAQKNEKIDASNSGAEQQDTSTPNPETTSDNQIAQGDEE